MPGRKIQQMCVRAEGALSGRDWLSGVDRPSIAACCFAPSLDRMEDLGHAKLWRNCANLQAWLTRFRERPSWASTLYPGTRLSSLYANLDLRKRDPADLMTC